MSVTTTFGYSGAEDRLWMSCSAWPQRIWLTRSRTQQVMQAVVGAIEAPEAHDPRPPAERAASGHDASLNRPQPGEAGQALRIGREAADVTRAAPALLCTQFLMVSTGENSELVFSTEAGERRLRLSRAGLHRWLHALHMVVAKSPWPQWTPPPDWLTRSYLPPALAALLVPPVGNAGEDGEPPPSAAS